MTLTEVTCRNQGTYMNSIFNAKNIWILIFYIIALHTLNLNISKTNQKYTKLLPTLLYKNFFEITKKKKKNTNKKITKIYRYIRNISETKQRYIIKHVPTNFKTINSKKFLCYCVLRLILNYLILRSIYLHIISFSGIFIKIACWIWLHSMGLT